MLILPVTATSSYVPPPVLLEKPNHFADLHITAPVYALPNATHRPPTRQAANLRMQI
jgi:hypothetical protein